MKILNAKQIRELDAYTIEHEPVASIDLMERACRAFVNWFTETFDAGKKIGIVCGTGNNGGDGLAIARMLREWGYPVKVWIVKGEAPESNDFKVNLERLNSKRVEVGEITSAVDAALFNDRDILIDAIFGSGLSRPVQGIYAQTIVCINAFNSVIVAIDIPSGLMADAPSSEPIVKADYTITFQLPKLAFLLPGNAQYVGDWHIVNIGLSKAFIKTLETSYSLVQKSNIRKIKKPRLKFDHKGNFGRALLVAGSYGKMGAAVLAARAAMRSGVGLLTVHIPKCGYPIIQTAVPEAMADSDNHAEIITEIPAVDHVDAVGIGPGIGQSDETANALLQLLKQSKKPLVIDADGLNILSRHSSWLQQLPAYTILTPHPKEFERLAGSWESDFEKLEKLRAFSKDHNVVVVLKGAYTAIAAPHGKIHFNSTGNPGMATGGTGDVLTGIITGILAQGYSPLEAAIYGVYLHGLAGDLAAGEKGPEAMIASDLINALPAAFLRLH